MYSNALPPIEAKQLLVLGRGSAAVELEESSRWPLLISGLRGSGAASNSRSRVYGLAQPFFQAALPAARRGTVTEAHAHDSSGRMALRLCVTSTVYARI